MSDLTPENIEQIVQACQDNAAALAEGLSQCFIQKKEITVGESSAAWDAEKIPDDFNGPGVVVSIKFDDQYLFALISESLPIPYWYKNPGESESSRLQTLAMEWSMNLVPEDLEASEFATVAVKNLKQSVSDAEPEDWATNFSMEMVGEDGSSSQLVVVWPLKQAPVPGEFPDETDEPAPASASIEPADIAQPFTDVGLSLARRNYPDGVNRILSLPVEVVVCLAEKNIDLDHLLKLGPGGLITFNKPCEAYLDLYVNNHRYCRGEAVKIGEKFGLKVMEVGVVEEREDPVLHEDEE